MLRSWSFEDGTEGESLTNPLMLQRDKRLYPAFQGEPACMECCRNTVVWSGVKGIACSQKDGVVWSPSSQVQMCSWNLGSGHSLLWHIAPIFSTWSFIMLVWVSIGLPQLPLGGKHHGRRFAPILCICEVGWKTYFNCLLWTFGTERVQSQRQNLFFTQMLLFRHPEAILGSARESWH